jgi:predicted dinucleotide-binding enzyme
MRIGILGTGVVGQALGAKFDELGQEVMIGTRAVADTLARREPGPYGNPPFSVWLEQHPRVKLGAYAEAAAFGEILVNATNGSAALEALRSAGEAHLKGKILIDISNPLDFSRGMPPSLFISNTDSLAETIQKAFPEAQVVKTLNTMTAGVMVNPGLVAGGDHHVFVSGNDAGAKARVTEILTSWFGWKNVIDLGDLSTARGAEMILPLWITLMGALQTPMFNFKIAR